ncbi:MAG: lysophospholipid acyltransferase family protein [Pyrinomonadaceae bacterium]
MDILRLTGYLLSKAFWFLRYEEIGNIPPNDSAPFLVVANHQTYIDPVWICLPMRRRIRYMAIEKAFGWPMIGKLIRFIGAFPVSAGRAGNLAAFRTSVKALKEGSVVMIFPEGVRSDAEGKAAEFQHGFINIAISAKVPILPVTILGGERIWPRGQKYPRLFRRVVIKYHPLVNIPHDRSGDSRDDVDDWAAKIAATVLRN